MTPAPRPLDKCERDEALTLGGPSGPARAYYDRWLRWWRRTHPADGRCDVLLADEYADWYRNRPLHLG